MASITIFLETPNWTLHHDPALDSMYLLSHVAVRMYIFFNCPLAVLVLNPQFDPEFPFKCVPLHAAHPFYPSPSPSPPLSCSSETDPLEDSSSTSSSGGDQVVLELVLEGLAPMEKGFHTPWCSQYSCPRELLLADPNSSMETLQEHHWWHLAHHV